MTLHSNLFLKELRMYQLHAYATQALAKLSSLMSLIKFYEYEATTLPVKVNV